MKKKLIKIGRNAKVASKKSVSNKVKNKILTKFAYLINKNKSKILFQNQKDVSNAIKRKFKENMINRLELDKNKINEIIRSVKKISKLKDPVNTILQEWKRPNGLKIRRVSVPLGVIGVIYESRPNVTADVSCLCFKSGNSVILRGGSESYFSNKIISNLFRKALLAYKVDKNFVQFIDVKKRSAVNFMLSKMDKFIDIIIPRGGKKLVSTVKKLSTVPTIGHLEGVCHTYIDKNADLKMSERIILNAKMRNTSICGATETLLMHEKILKKFVNPILNRLEKSKCKIYADNKIKKIFKGKALKAKKNNWGKEYLSSKISVKSVKDIKEAVDHVNRYGTMHTDAIITKNKNNANFFLKNVKSSIAIHNSSTQFADGGEFGFGGEVGISTNKIPPRGPVGLEQLISYKYEVLGSGQIRK